MKQAHELCVKQGVDRARLKAALDSNDNWGKMVHAFEFLTIEAVESGELTLQELIDADEPAVAAVLDSWPEDDDEASG